jgi:phosphopantothenoylcysteine decarboxylase / phosphopantothenate---cysteine ligase
MWLVNNMDILRDKNIILGVTGSIAAYKAADLASKLTQAGANVDVIITQAGLQFITPLTFQSVTGRRAFTDADLWGNTGHVTHIGLGRGADLMAIAPASANTMAKLAHGIADNLLSVAALAARCPIIIAPAMDAGMFDHPATQSNLEILKQRGVTVIGPAAGHLASGMIGVGRMTEPTEIIGHMRLRMAQNGPLSGKRIIVTAAGTQEPIDPVRAITNRSSGKQGFAIAQAALDAGAEVVLICGPTHLSTPIGARRLDIKTSEEMLGAVLDELKLADGLIMAAAVADFRPACFYDQKIKKSSHLLDLHLELTPDILKAVSGYKKDHNLSLVTIGFAAESENLLENARVKLAEKDLDLIVANDITALDAGFEVDTNRVCLLFADNRREDLPLMTKIEVAETVIKYTVDLLLKEKKNDQ